MNIQVAPVPTWKRASLFVIDVLWSLVILISFFEIVTYTFAL